MPGVVLGFNDSGNAPEVFAFDSTGRALRSWRVASASMRDWEAAAMGPCPPVTQPCLYIGDVGDNEGRRPTVTIYRMPEPGQGAAGDRGPIRAERLSVAYPDRPHDVEAMYVGGDGSTFLITKRPLPDRDGRPRPTLVFRVPASAWASAPTRHTVAELADSLPIYPGTARGRQVTDAALSPDGRYLAVRTYGEVYTFLVDASTWLPAKGVPPTVCLVADLRERQGEGIGWWWDRRRLLLTSEGQREDLIVVECAMPRPQ